MQAPITEAEVIVLGSLNQDRVVRTRRLPQPGETVLGSDYREFLGGKGANQAVAAARAARGRVSFLAAIGDDSPGRQGLETLASEGIDVSLVRVLTGRVTGTALILVDESGNNQIVVAPGANGCLETRHIDAAAVRRMQSARALLASCEVPLPTVRAALSLARQAGLVTVLNPAPAEDVKALVSMLKHANAVVPNATEATAMTGMSVRGPEDAMRAGQRLRDLGAETAIITLGDQGAVVVGEEVAHYDAPRVEARDTTGAGDAFCGVLAARIAGGDAIDGAVRQAISAASLTVRGEGAIASLPTRYEMRALCNA